MTSDVFAIPCALFSIATVSSSRSRSLEKRAKLMGSTAGDQKNAVARPAS